MCLHIVCRNNEDTSPFVVKEKQQRLKKKINHARVAIVGSPVLNGEDTGSSEDVSSDEETPSYQMFDSSQCLGTSETAPNRTEVTTMEAYGFELKDPTKEDMRLYEGLVQNCVLLFVCVRFCACVCVMVFACVYVFLYACACVCMYSLRSVVICMCV